MIRAAAIRSADGSARRISCGSCRNTVAQSRKHLSAATTSTIESSVPAWVSLSLGSAYFRSGKLADAEREYKAAIAADPTIGRSA